MNHIVALSGGKDSTAMALRLAEIEPRDYLYICNPTGDELPEMVQHWKHLEQLLGKPLEQVTNQTLGFWMKEFAALSKLETALVYAITENRTDNCIHQSASTRDALCGTPRRRRNARGYLLGRCCERFPIAPVGLGFRESRQLSEISRRPDSRAYGLCQMFRPTLN